MVKGQYKFHHPENVNVKQSSGPWKSVALALVTFGTICLIIVALTVPWRSVNQSSERNISNDRPSYDSYKDDQSTEFATEESSTPTDSNTMKYADVDTMENSFESASEKSSPYKVQPDIETPSNDSDSQQIDDGSNNQTNKSNKPIDSNTSLENNNNIKQNDTNENFLLHPIVESNIETRNKSNLNNLNRTGVNNDDYKKQSDEFNTLINAVKNYNLSENNNDDYNHNKTKQEETLFLPTVKSNTGENNNDSKDSNLNNVKESVIQKEDNNTEANDSKSSENDNNYNNTKVDEVLSPNVESKIETKNVTNTNTVQFLSKDEIDSNKQLKNADSNKNATEKKDDDNDDNKPLKKSYFINAKIFDSYIEANVNDTRFMDRIYKYCPLNEINETNTCQSNLCKRSASKMLSLMEYDSKPCENFYVHACQGISNDYVVEVKKDLKIKQYITEKVKKINLDSPHYLQVFKDFFTTCKQFKPTEACYANIKSLVSSVGVYFDKGDSGADNLPPVTNLLTELLKRNIPIFFDVTIDIDRNTGKFITVIKPVLYQKVISNIMENPYNKICMKEIQTNKKNVDLYKDSYAVYKKCDNSLDEFVKVTTETLKDMNVFAKTKESIQDVIKNIKYIFDFIIKLMPTPIELNNAYENKNVEYFTVDQLNERFKPFNWTYIFEELVPDFSCQDDKVLVHFPKILNEIFDILCQVQPRSMHNTILTLYTHQLFRTYKQDQIAADRNAHCMDLSIKLMEDVGSYLFINSIQTEKIAADTVELKKIFDHTRETLKSEISIGKWITGRSTTKTEARNKIGNLTLETFDNYNLTIMNSDLESFYNNVTLKEAFVIYGDNLQKRIRTVMYSMYKQDPTLQRNLWFYLVKPLSTELKTISSLNIIAAPLGAVDRETLLTDLPDYIKMSDIAFQLAKELNNYLQMNNFKLGSYDLLNGTTELSVEDINGQEIYIQMDTELALKERIIDATGAELALLAYRRSETDPDAPLPWLSKTPEQLFYLNLAQQMCSKQPISTYVSMFDIGKMHPMFKVNSIPVNTLRFAEIFKCIKIDNMKGSIKIAQPSDDY